MSLRFQILNVVVTSRHMVTFESNWNSNSSSSQLIIHAGNFMNLILSIGYHKNTLLLEWNQHISETSSW